MDRIRSPHTATRRTEPKMRERAIAAMRDAVSDGKAASVTEIAHRDRDPFRILISTILSLRTKDEVTSAASERLFRLAQTPGALAVLTPRTIERAIYPVGFYRTKARTVRETARRLEKEFGGRVPDTIEELLTFKGVGRKTAALVVSLGYAREAICVDTHVHRISNRLGWVDTRTPEQTERALMIVLPRRHWIGINDTMVSFGQRVCMPVSPRCSACPLHAYCPRRGVTRHR
ncbi:MAG TPA: endonuclease III [Candidatus Krumholzibacteria bacterium]|nr:endonuclease III [Candidatus Krumholzibacteria bacterium]